MLKEGDAAPDFTTRDENGNQVRLSDLRGQKVALYFYPKDDTPGCTKEACSFRDNYSAVEEAGVKVLGVSLDDEASHQAFISKYDLPFTLLSDPDKKLMKEWGAYGEKMMYGVKKIGIIRSSVWVGPDGTVKKHWKKIADAAKHPEQVLELLRA